MKKILSAFLALAMLVSMMAVMSIGTAAAEPLKVVGIYRINGNNDDLYVVFNKKVSAPAADTEFQLVLAACGWGGTPTGDGWDAATTVINRVHFPFTEVVSDQVFKFTRAGHVSWACDGQNINTEHAVAVEPVGGFWFWGLAGEEDLYTADGVEALVYDIEAAYNTLVDGNPVQDPWTVHTPCHTIAKTTNGAVNAVAAVADITVPEALESNKPAQPDNPSTGDIFTVCVAVASLSAAGLAISKKRR